MNFLTVSSYNSSPLSLAAIIERDLIAGCVHANPLLGVVDNGGEAVRHRDRQGNIKEAVGSGGSIIDAVTGQAWTESNNGSWFPAEFKNTRPATAGGYTWTEIDVMERDVVPGSTFTVIGNSDNLRRNPDLIQVEKDAGRILLTPRTTEGIMDVKPLFRGVCE